MMAWYLLARVWTAAPTPGRCRKGGIDEGEQPERAAQRELLEEIGTDRVEIIAQTDDWLTYDLPDELMGKIWGGRYRGQKQKWFLMRFTGVDKHIDIATEHPEFRAWKWATIESLPLRIVPFKKDLYETVVERFGPIVAAHFP